MDDSTGWPVRRLRQLPRGASLPPDGEGRRGAAFGFLSVWAEEPTARPGPEGRMWGRARIRGNGERETVETYRERGTQRGRWMAVLRGQTVRHSQTAQDEGQSDGDETRGRSR